MFATFAIFVGFFTVEQSNWGCGYRFLDQVSSSLGTFCEDRHTGGPQRIQETGSTAGNTEISEALYEFYGDYTLITIQFGKVGLDQIIRANARCSVKQGHINLWICHNTVLSYPLAS